MHDLMRMYMIRTTHTLNRGHHRLDQFVEFGFRQLELRPERRCCVLGSLFVGRSNFEVFARRELTHALLGYKPIQITNKSSRVLIFFVMVLLTLVFWSNTAFAHDALVIPPTRLEFDATGAPKNCADDIEFRALLGDWVAPETLTEEASRRLTVLIRRSPTGGKFADVTLVDAAGTVLGEHHERYGAKAECYRVLYESARGAAKLLGAFEKPPEPEPPVCPACPACAACPSTPKCPIPETPRKAPKIVQTATIPTRRAFFGAGLFIGTGFTWNTFVGPQFSLGFVPSPHAPSIHVEMNGAWTQQTISKLNVDIVPLFGSICYSRSVFRVCSGLTTTFFQAKNAELVPGADELRTTLAGHVRMGAEFGIAGPFSIRVDAFAMLRFWQRSYGNELATLDARGPFGAGATAMGVWGFE
jgi:hypothetical protein